MSCETGPNKIARLAGQVSGGISRLAGKAAYYAGFNSPRRASELAPFIRHAALGGAIGVAAMVAVRQVRRRRRLAGSRAYIEKGFDMVAGQALTDQYSGSRLSENSLRTVLGPGSISKPVVKMGGEDDLFLGDGPNGHIYYSLPDDGVAQINVLVPRQGREQAMAQALDGTTLSRNRFRKREA